MNKKVVMVTGAARGIGKSIAKVFASKNYDIILHYHTSKDEALALKESLEKEYNIQVFLVSCNLMNELEIEKLVEEVKLKYQKIDVLINNAALSMDCEMIEKTKEQFLKVLEVNLIAPFLLIKGLSSILIGGTVINISSTDADDTGSSLSIDYSASKAGLNSITKTLSLALPNIRICAIAPNWVKTEAVLEMDKEYLEKELKRVGQKELIEPIEVANKVLEVVENKEIISGSIVRIDRKEEQ